MQAQPTNMATPGAACMPSPGLSAHLGSIDLDQEPVSARTRSRISASWTAGETGSIVGAARALKNGRLQPTARLDAYVERINPARHIEAAAAEASINDASAEAAAQPGRPRRTAIVADAAATKAKAAKAERAEEAQMVAALRAYDKAPMKSTKSSQVQRMG